MSLLIDELATYLQTAGVGTVGTDIFIGQQPPKPDSCVTLIETSGLEPSGYVPLVKPTIQILVRSLSYATGRAKAASVFAALQRKANLAFTGHHVYYILATSDVGYIQRDENNRHEWTMNFRLETRDV